MEKKKTKKRGKDKFLVITIKEHIPDLVNEYCKDSGLNPQDVGFNMGFIVGACGKADGGDAMMSLISLNQLFFYAWMHFAKKHEGKYKYGFESEKQIQEALEKVKEQIKKQPKPTPSYMGWQGGED